MQQVLKSVLRAVLIVIALGFSVVSNATTVTMLSDEELVVDSRLIITGEVRSVVSAWDEARTMIWTFVEVRRDVLLKGTLLDERIVLKQPGGVVGDSVIQVFGQPSFVPGQRVLLYLNTAPDGTLHVAHSFMGMFSIVDDRSTGQRFAERSIQAAETAIIPRRDAEIITDRGPLDNRLQNIEDTIRREARTIYEKELESSRQPIVAVPQEYDERVLSGAGLTPSFAFIGGGIRWMQADSGQPVIYHLNPSNSPVAGGGLAEFNRAMEAWSVRSGANIRLQLGAQTGSCGSVSDRSNTISFGDCRNQLDPPVGCSGVLAQTSVSYTFDTKVINGTTFNRMLETDIVFNKGMNCFLGNSANLAEVGCHELGHSIGLDHSNNPSAIMWATARGQGRDATLAADDSSGAMAIYPSSGSGGGGGGSGVPVVTRIKLKRANTKLIVIGNNLNPNCLIQLNGVVLDPGATRFDFELGRLVFRGALPLGPVGFNLVVVISGDEESAPFRF